MPDNRQKISQAAYESLDAVRQAFEKSHGVEMTISQAAVMLSKRYLADMEG